MAGNRKLPFGYRMELGKIVVYPKEAELVTYIFRQYSLGASYKELVKHLREQDVPYDQGKLWNKNMVARILENRKYIGQPGWPSIIDSDLNRVAELRQALDHELEQRPIDEDAAKGLAMELASAQYEGIGSQEYETERLRRLFQRQGPMQCLDAELLRSTVNRIQVHGKKVKVRLKNGQVFERSAQT